MDFPPFTAAMAPKVRRPAAALAALGGGARGRVRRPAARVEADPPPLDIGEAWRRGDVVEFHALPLEEVLKGPRVVVEEASYMEANVTVAGVLGKVVAIPGATKVEIALEGTSSEALLRAHSVGGRKFHLHQCPLDCDGRETSETLIHGKKLRLVLDMSKEEAWTNNLVEVPKAPVDVDELKSLRAEAAAMGRGKGPGEERMAKGSSSSSSTKKAKKKKDEKKKKKKKKDKKKKRDKGESEEKEKNELKKQEMKNHMGKTPMSSGVKDPALLLSGTGLDARERVRQRVQRAARRYLQRKSSRMSETSSSSSSGDSTSKGTVEEFQNTIFTESTKVRKLAEHFPGALATEGLTAMRESLLQVEGYQEERSHLRPTALLYFRSVLQRKASGAQGRELLTHCTAVDMLMNGRIAGALDLLMQRVKSIESTQQGVHYSVSQRLEVLPQEGMTLTGREEMKEAQKESYADSRLRWLSSMPDKSGGLRESKGSKGKDGKDGKNVKSKGKGDGGKREDADKKAK